MMPWIKAIHLFWVSMKFLQYYQLPYQSFHSLYLLVYKNIYMKENINENEQQENYTFNF